jgi:mannose-6-phosphate isomerase-like protein (cupin superfamily)
MIQVINLAERFNKIPDYWHPRIVGQVNDMHLKLVKVQGDFVWHHHDTEDEMFLVIEGTLTIKLRDGDLQLRAGEFVVIPRGVEHCPVAPQEVKLMLLEPATTSNTGSVANERTVEPEWMES